MSKSFSSPGDAASRATDAIERRGFFSRSGAIVIGGLIGLVPAATALAVFFDPLRRNGRSGKFIRVAPVSAVPDDGVPRQFPVVAERVDAWNRSLEPVGAVYLRRQPGAAVPECLSATCPHAGCFVAYDGVTKTFRCPCHNSSFEPDGAIIPPSPSPRAMDALACEVRQDEVLVKFENFYAGKAEKIVKS
jgi:quinol---cytochrome c reductase iron-sulfur subunit, bacillus type